MINILKNILCFLGVHDWYKKDGKSGLFCKNECYNCGELKPKN